MFSSIRMLKHNNTWHAYYPKSRSGTDEHAVREAVKADILSANLLAGRCDARGRLYRDQEYLSRNELLSGVERPDPRTSLEIAADIARLKTATQKPTVTETHEEIVNRHLRAKLEGIKPAGMSDQEWQARRSLAESDRRLQKERDEAARQSIRDSKSYANVLAKIETLEFFTKFDPTVSPAIANALKAHRQVLHDTADLAAIWHNLGQIESNILGTISSDAVVFRPATDVAEVHAQWREGSVFDEPPKTLIDNNQVFVSYTHQGKGLGIHADLVEGKSEEQIVSTFFPSADVA